MGWAKQRLKWLLDRLFLRSAIVESQSNIRKLRADSQLLMADAQGLNESLLIAEKKIEYLSTKLDAYAEAQDQLKEAIEEKLKKAVANEFRQSEAMGALLRLLPLKLPLPPTRGWAASPDFLLHLYQYISVKKPKMVVELGSGVSSIVTAAALKVNGGGGRLHCLDHDRVYAERTSGFLAQQRLTDVATVHHAPLVPWRPAVPTELGEEWQWYSVPAAVAQLKSIDLLIVDGPPNKTGPFSRYPAVPYFGARMAKGCVVYLDDARRTDEKAIAKTWSQEYGLRLNLFQKQCEFEKGLAVLTVDRLSPDEKPIKSRPARARAVTQA
ncbi:MAG TPA: class I SAM-dependent methyltransferase [Methyloceanibacter sp.]|nr:class I SAM-dependent methyltransferase [Methyloceanibacter sp.]